MSQLGYTHGRPWQLGACCVNLPLEQWTGEMQGEVRVGRGVRCWRWRGGNEQAPVRTAGCREQPRDQPRLWYPAYLPAPSLHPPAFNNAGHYPSAEVMSWRAGSTVSGLSMRASHKRVYRG